MITRTTTNANVEVIGLNVETMEIETRYIDMPRADAKDIEKALKIARKLYDGTNGFSAAKIGRIDIPATLTGAYEDDFSIIAVELDNKTRRPVEAINYPEITRKFISKLSPDELMVLLKELAELRV